MTKTAIITGASKGIGAAIALSLAKNGYDLFLCGNHSTQELTKICRQCRTLGSQCTTYTGDLSNPIEAENIVMQTLSLYEHIDVLVNNAGISHIGLMQSMSEQDWNHLLSVNLSAAFYLCKQVVPHMVQQKQGKILNISSIWGENGASCEVAKYLYKGLGKRTCTKRNLRQCDFLWYDRYTDECRIYSGGNHGNLRRNPLWTHGFCRRSGRFCCPFIKSLSVYDRSDYRF